MKKYQKRDRFTENMQTLNIAPETFTDIIKNINASMYEGINTGVNLFLTGVYNQWLKIWAEWNVYIVIASVLIIGGIILQIIMIRIDGPNSRLPSWFNTLVGKLLYLIIFFSLWIGSFKVWGLI